MSYLREGTILQGRVTRFRIKKVLGQGTFGITYLATAPMKMQGPLGTIETEGKVAVKEFFMRDINGRSGSLVTSGTQGGLFDNYKKKFLREARNLSKMIHPNIVKVMDSFEANGTAYFVMEFLGGGSLNEYISQKGSLTEMESMPILRDIGSALSFMHASKMLHLDMKPANVMLREDGSAVVIDFGLSKQYDSNGRPETSTNVGLGTEGYAPLEQSVYRVGKDFPATMDVYALGGTLFKMLTGLTPPNSPYVLNTKNCLRQELQEHGVSNAMIACITKAMAPMVKDRYQSVNAFLSDLSKVNGSTKNRATLADRTNDRTVRVDRINDRTVRADRTNDRTVHADGTNDGTVRADGTILEAEVVEVQPVTKGLSPTLHHATQGNSKKKAAVAKDNTKRSEPTLTPAEMKQLGDACLKRRDYNGATKWYEKAAYQGNANAQYELGMLYLRGFGLKIDEAKAKALEWLRKAADQNNNEAKKALNRMMSSSTVVSTPSKQSSPSVQKPYPQNNQFSKTDSIVKPWKRYKWLLLVTGILVIALVIGMVTRKEEVIPPMDISEINVEKETFEVNGVSFNMIHVHGGTFMMGATNEQELDVDDDERPAHQVTLSDYSIGETEVTQALWKAVMGSNPSHFTGDDNCPVETVSWDDCQVFITKLNQITGRKFRLPTEAEWEYAARGGRSEGNKYAGSANIDTVAWYGGSVTHPVKTKLPNELGICDMSGNVWEWCQDWYGGDYYTSSPQTNPQGPSSGSYRVRRGGCWYYGAENCRVACRNGSTPDYRSSDLGLRLALTEATAKNVTDKAYSIPDDFLDYVPKEYDSYDNAAEKREVNDEQAP